jgi:hypothetical protein
MSTRIARSSFALAAASVLALASPASAQTADQIKAAKQTAAEALDAYNNNEFDKALTLFEKARAVYPSAQVLRLIGYTEIALEHWAKAADALDAALDSKITPLAGADRKEAQEQLAKATAHLGTLALKSKVAGAKVAIDGGEPLALPLERSLRIAEGTHKLVVTAPEHLDTPREVKIEAGKHTELAIDPEPKPKPKPPPPPPAPPPVPERKAWVPQQKLVGMVAAGTGVAFGAAALGTVIAAGHWRSIANADVAKHKAIYGDRCAMGDPRLCAFDIEVTNREASRANTLRNAAAGFGVTAAVLAATGVVFYVFAPKPTKPAAPPSDEAAPPPPPPPSASLGFSVAGGPGLFCTGSF